MKIITGALVVALVVVGYLFWDRGGQLDEAEGRLRETERDLRVADARSASDELQLQACGEVLVRAKKLIGSQARHIYRLFADAMPALAEHAFIEGQGNDKPGFSDILRSLDDRRRHQQMARRDLRNYGWAPSSSSDEGGTNLAASCLGVS